MSAYKLFRSRSNSWQAQQKAKYTPTAYEVAKMRVVYDTSPTCPVGAPSRDGASNRNLKPAPKVAPPPPTSSRANRRQGIIFNVQALPQELKALQGQSDSKNPTGPA
ncbi:hypothetical protein PGT21_029078 [Puccinia graminis f. sp. tritici]|nr:hypothetical protein PGT21_029078 [Puccinia graminis f. sp. tritici]